MSPEQEQVTVMILYVDLKCSCCYKRVKKVLCKFPQIRDQVFDEDKNKVTITVVCCDPEKLRDKLCCKGGKFIQSIEIVEPKPKLKHKSEPEITKPPPPPVCKPDTPKKPESPPMSPVVRMPDPPVAVCCQECYEGRGGGPCNYGNGRREPCCQECYEGRSGGPCNYGYGRPVQGPCYDDYGYPYRPPCNVSRCDNYFSEDNPQGCLVM